MEAWAASANVLFVGCRTPGITQDAPFHYDNAVCGTAEHVRRRGARCVHTHAMGRAGEGVRGVCLCRPPISVRPELRAGALMLNDGNKVAVLGFGFGEKTRHLRMPVVRMATIR